MQPPGDRLDDFSNEQVVALLFAAYGGPRPAFSAAHVAGVAHECGDESYVVLVPAEPTPFADAGLSDAIVVETRCVGPEWRVLLPASGW